MSPELHTLRPRLSAIADQVDVLALQRTLASAMLALAGESAGIFYVDDHFVPYSGAKPVAMGHNGKRGRCEPGRADTLITNARGLAVCFTTGEPSHLAKTMAEVVLAPDRAGVRLRGSRVGGREEQCEGGEDQRAEHRARVSARGRPAEQFAIYGDARRTACSPRTDVAAIAAARAGRPTSIATSSSGTTRGCVWSEARAKVSQAK